MNDLASYSRVPKIKGREENIEEDQKNLLKVDQWKTLLLEDFIDPSLLFL